MNEHADLGDVIRAIARGASVDWDGIESPSADATLLGVLQELRVISRIAEVHGSNRPNAESRPADSRFDDLKQWGPLTLLECVGRGAYGDVYRAWDPRLEREVALKLLPSAEQDEQSASVIQEARLLARLRHPNVATVYGADCIGGRTGLWMEFVDGHDLEEIIREQGPLPGAVREIGVQLSGALAAVHRAGVLHRDVKASNIRLTDDGRAVLLDFGSGRPREMGGASRDLMGTPLYLAPEIFAGAPADERSDVYSLGVVLFYLLAGTHPVSGATLDAVRRAHADARGRRAAEASPETPKRLAAVVDRAIDPHPEKRYQSATELQHALESLAPRSWRRSRLAATLFIAGGVTSLLIARAAIRARQHTGGVLQAAIAPQPASSTGHLPAPETLANAPQPSSSPPDIAFKGRDWALIAAFENRTGEAILDGTLEFALERELSNSSFVNVVPRERIDDVLRLMVKPADARIDTQLGREICLRDGGIRALITGRVEKVGTTYVLTSQIVDPRDGVVIRSLSEEAAAQAGLLPALRRQGLRLREALGEMVSTIRRSEAALERVTTPSLHALQLYSQASAFMLGDWNTWKDAPAEQLLRQAVSEDDQFASAYILLAFTVHHQDRFTAEHLMYASRAFQLATRTSDVERYFIVGSYYSLLEQSSQTDAERESHRRRAIAAYESLLRIKPDHYWGSGNLFAEFEALHQEPEATNALIHLAEVRPSSLSFQLLVGERLAARGEANRVRTIIRRLQTLVPLDAARQSPQAVASVKLLEAWDAWAGYDVKRVRRIADDLRNSAATVDDATFAVLAGPLSSLYMGLGRISDSRRVAARLRLPAPPDVLPAPLLQEVALGKPGAIDVLRDLMATNFRDLTNVPFNWAVLVALFEVGRVDDAFTFKFPDGPEAFRPAIDAFKAVAEGRIEDGVLAFNMAKQRLFVAPGMELVWAQVVAEAWRRKGRPQAAIAVLEKALANGWTGVPMAGYNSVAIWIQARTLIADLYRATGRTREAAAIDRQLLKLLAEADPDYLLLVQLRQRYGDAP